MGCSSPKVLSDFVLATLKGDGRRIVSFCQLQVLKPPRPVRNYNTAAIAEKDLVK
ncbi:hypothetical protein [Anaplasma phagocytophilum]|uniref:hypothetical protein n=1 Tax=Anaplasma phagocytophilum TaxID=948 RepID=UPI000AD912BB|nr:hypothetical protein [Anaplasma phagocytophilum]